MKRQTGFFLFFVAALCCLFRDAMSAIGQSWQQDEYSHGYFIPVIALVLLLNAMEDRQVTAKPSWAGFVIILACIVMAFLFQMAGIRALLPELFLLSLIGAVVAFWGVKASWQCAGALGFILFCTPLPTFFYYPLSMATQATSTSLGAGVMEMLNVPVFQDGNIIDLGGYKLQVVEACSGLRYLFPLLSISYLFAYFYKASMLKRGMVFLSAIPIAVLMNGLRIAMIGVTVDRWGAQMAEGLLHEVEGGVVFLGCILCLMLEVRLLQCVGRKGILDWNAIRLPSFARFTPPALGMPAYTACCAVLIALVLGYSVPALSGHGLRDVKLRQPFSAFPLQLGPWVGHFDPFDPAALTKLGGADYLLADYTKPAAPLVNLYVLYYAHQDSSSNEAVHTPTVCIPASGWKVESVTPLTVTLASGVRIPLNKVLIAKDGVRQVVYYWYDQDGHPTGGVAQTRLYTLRNALLHGRTNGALVRLTTIIAPGEAESAAERRLTGFMETVIDPLNSFVFPQR